VPQPFTVLIAAADALPALKARAEGDGSELLAFSDADALKALEAITKRRPKVVALERLFAVTPRGAALINRIKADPALSGAEIRVISRDSDQMRVSPRRPVDGHAGVAVANAAPAIAPPEALDQRGTRRAPRFRITPALDILVDGNPATLIDLSAVGAQVVSGSVLKPNQRIRIALADDQGSVKFNGAVAWASFEIPPTSGPRYRAGINFLDADTTAIDAYCLRHKA
jgi:hypothetical protein